jgi:hypothetical protein
VSGIDLYFVLHLRTGRRGVRRIYSRNIFLGASISGAEDCARCLPLDAGGWKAKCKLPSSHPFHSDVQLELVFILDFHVLFHVIR